MINLIKNEIVKIVHKKSFKVFCIVVFLLVVLSLSIDLITSKLFDADKYYIDSSYEIYNDRLDDYDLSNRDEVRMYAEDKAMAETFALLKKYPDVDSAEHYFIDTEIRSLFEQMYYAQYVTKDLVEYESCYKIYQEMLVKLEKFDWKKNLTEEKNNYLKEISELEKNTNINQDDKLKQIEVLNVKIKAIDYRFKYEVPYSYDDISYLIDEYESNGVNYLMMNQNEDFYTKRSELVNKRNVEEEYKVAEYKLEHGIIYDSNKNELMDNICVMFMFTNMIILLVVMIVVGGVLADEFNKGTIKQLLVRPFSRTKILLSKVIASLLMIILFAFLYYLLYIVAYSISYSDFTALFSSVVDYDFNVHSAFDMNLMVYCIINLLAILPQYFIIFAFVLFISVLTTSSIGAVGAGFGLLFMSETIKMMLPEKYLVYLPTYCWDWSCFLFGGVSSSEYMTFTNCLVVCVITMVLLIVGAFILFKNKDVKNQ